MFTFQHGSFLWLLLIIPFIVLIFLRFLNWRKKQIQAMGNPRLITQLLKGKISGRVTTKLVLNTVALLLATFGLANLQMGKDTQKVKRKGVDVMFALDVSKSMLAKDVRPDRLSRAKLLIRSMIDQMQGDRTGLILFAGRAYLQAPLTVDYANTQMMLNTAGPDIVPTQGTVLGDALEIAQQAFQDKTPASKVIILISDGEDHDAKAVEMAKAAARHGIVIHTIGIGSASGAPIFDPATGANKIDDQGNEVISKLNEPELQDIAQAGKGSYQLLRNNNQTATTLLTAINNMEGKRAETVIFARYKSYFQYFLLLALLLLLADWLLPAARSGHTMTQTPDTAQ